MSDLAQDKLIVIALRYLEEGKDQSKKGGDPHRATNMLLGSIAAALIAIAKGGENERVCIKHGAHDTATCPACCGEDVG